MPRMATGSDGVGANSDAAVETGSEVMRQTSPSSHLPLRKKEGRPSPTKEE